MAKKPIRVYRRSTSRLKSPSGPEFGPDAGEMQPVQVYKNGFDRDRLSITQHVLDHPA